MSDIEEFLNDAYYGMIDAVNLGKLSREKFDHHFNLLMKQMRAAQHRLHLTAFGVGLLAFLAGFGICWFAFVR